MARLSREFFGRDARTVARALVGTRLVAGGVVLRVTETEAYVGPHDTACHSRMGRTARNAPMWGEPGHAYVYLCYGIHWMLNLVTGRGDGQAVLLRACEVLEGLPLVLARRRSHAGPGLVAGPGKVAQALALDASFNHHDVCAAGGLEAHAALTARTRVALGARVGIDYAAPSDRRAALRFADARSAAVTHRALLAPPFVRPAAASTASMPRPPRADRPLRSARARR
jgi:DNA-3-methyladenine glycosylase